MTETGHFSGFMLTGLRVILHDQFAVCSRQLLKLCRGPKVRLFHGDRLSKSVHGHSYKCIRL